MPSAACVLIEGIHREQRSRARTSCPSRESRKGCRSRRDRFCRSGQIYCSGLSESAIRYSAARTLLSAETKLDSTTTTRTRPSREQAGKTDTNPF
jgi:hypothetical protein